MAPSLLTASFFTGLMPGVGPVNYMRYAMLIDFVELVARQPVWGVAAGSCAGMLVNWLLARFFIFRDRTA